MPDYIPEPDAEFLGWMNTLLSALQSNLSDYGIVQADLSPVQLAHASWADSHTAHLTAQVVAEAATTLKDNNSVTVENLVRSLARRIQANPAVTDEAKRRAGLPVHDTTRTPRTAPISRPVAEVDTSERLRHTIHFKDQNAPRKAKPKGVMGCEIWAKVGGAPPTDPSECQFVANDTNSPYLNQFTGADAGKTVHYILRWLSSRQEKGPWSETISATIPA